MIVIDGLVVRSSGDRTDQGVDGIAGERQLGRRVVTEVSRDGFADERRHAETPPPSLEHQLVVCLAGDAQVGRDVGGHNRYHDIAISRLRQDTSCTRVATWPQAQCEPALPIR